MKVVDLTVGLDDFNEIRRGLRAVSDDAGAKFIKDANRRIGDVIVERAKARARRLAPTSLAGNSLRRLYANVARRDIRRTQAQTKASIKIGKKSTPYAMGAEFGSVAHRQFSPWRGNQWPGTQRFPGGTGYIIQPTLRESEQDIREFYADVYQQALRRFTGARMR